MPCIINMPMIIFFFDTIVGVGGGGGGGAGLELKDDKGLPVLSLDDNGDEDGECVIAFDDVCQRFLPQLAQNFTDPMPRLEPHSGQNFIDVNILIMMNICFLSQNSQSLLAC